MEQHFNTDNRESGDKPIFEREKSPLRDAYILLEAHNPQELSLHYTEEDQKLMKSGEWDYMNQDLTVNKVKNMLENVAPSALTEEEVNWRNEMLWFWYHHAISCAIWRYKNQAVAKEMAAHARALQSEDHPNQITRLLELLVNDRLREAEDFAAVIKDDVEKDTAKSLIEEYKNKNWFL